MPEVASVTEAPGPREGTGGRRHQGSWGGPPSRCIGLRRPPVLLEAPGPYVPDGIDLDEVDARWQALCRRNPAYFDGRVRNEGFDIEYLASPRHPDEATGPGTEDVRPPEADETGGGLIR